MAKSEANQDGLMPSMVDRLIDPDSAGTVWRRGYSVEQMINVVRRDVEDLLNTRQTQQGIPDELVEVHHSLACYGLPDIAGFEAISPQQQEAIGRAIESVVSKFEPRLKEVRATLTKATDGKSHNVSFRIDAKLHLEPAPEIAFETVLELTTGHYSVSSSLS